MKSCPRCGSLAPDHANFCPKCGYPLTSQTSTMAQSFPEIKEDLRIYDLIIEEAKKLPQDKKALLVLGVRKSGLTTAAKILNKKLSGTNFTAIAMEPILADPTNFEQKLKDFFAELNYHLTDSQQSVKKIILAPCYDLYLALKQELRNEKIIEKFLENVKVIPFSLDEDDALSLLYHKRALQVSKGQNLPVLPKDRILSRLEKYAHKVFYCPYVDKEKQDTFYIPLIKDFVDRNYHVLGDDSSFNEQAGGIESNVAVITYGLSLGLDSTRRIYNSLASYLSKLSPNLSSFLMGRLATYLGVILKVGAVGSPIYIWTRLESKQDVTLVDQIRESLDILKKVSDAELIAICNKVEGEMVKDGKTIVVGEIYEAVKSLISDKKDEVIKMAEQLSRDPNFIRMFTESVKTDEEFKKYIDKITATNASPLELLLLEEEITKLVSNRIGLKELREINDLKELLYRSIFDLDEVGVGILNYEIDAKLIQKVKEVIDNAKDRMVIITGEVGSGKTSLLYLVGKRLLNENSKCYYIRDYTEFHPFSSEGTSNTYVLYDIDDEETAKQFFKRIFDLKEDKFAKVIIAVRTEYLTQEILKQLEADSRFKLIKVEYRDDVLREIAKRRLQRYLQESITQNQIDRIAEVLVEKSKGISIGKKPTHSNGIPLYITEAIKYLRNRIKAVGHYDEKMLDELPSGVVDMIVKILKDEAKRNPSLLIEYYLVSHYPGLPMEYEVAFSSFNIKADYIDKTPYGLSLHPLYRDLLDAIDQGRLIQYTKEDLSIEVKQAKNLDNQQYLKLYLNTIRCESSHCQDLILFSQRTINAIPKLKAALEEFENNNTNASLRDLSDLLLFASTIYLDGEMQKMRKPEESVGYGKFKLEAALSRGRLYDFLVNNYLSGKSLTSAISGATRPFYYILAFYAGRLLPNKITYEIASWFMEGGLIPEPNKTLEKIARYYVDAPLSIRRYITAISNILENLEYLKPSDNFSKGMLYYCEGKYEEALKELDVAISLDPNNPEYHNGKGNVLRALGKYDDALKEYDMAIVLNPNNPTYYINRGNTLSSIRRYDEALREFDVATRLNPNDPDYHNNKGNVLYDLHRYDEALREFDVATRLNPNDPDYHNGKGNVLRALGKYDDALKEFDMAVSLNPNNSVYHFNRGNTLYNLRRNGEALKELDVAISLDPNNPEYHNGKGNVLRALGKYDDALKEYLIAISLDSSNPDYYYNVGITLYNLRLYKDALKALDTALSLNPYEADYHNDKGIVLGQLGEYEEALKEFNIATSLDPNNPRYHNNKGAVLYNLGRYDEALREYDIAISLNPNDPDYHNNKGNVLNDLHRYDEALREYDMATSLDPNNPVYHKNKGLFFYNLGRYDEALREFDVAISLNPNNPDYHNGKGAVLYNLGRYDEALREFDVAISLNPNNPDYHNNKGNVLNDLHRYDEALREYDVAISLDPTDLLYYLGKARVLCSKGDIKAAMKLIESFKSKLSKESYENLKKECKNLARKSH